MRKKALEDKIEVIFSLKYDIELPLEEQERLTDELINYENVYKERFGKYYIPKGYELKPKSI